MKQFRHIIIVALLILGTFSLVLYTTSCKNKCGTTTCQNGGTCESNKCVCPHGYSGYSCQTGWSDVVIGTYRCTRSNCHPAVTGDSVWQSAITKNATNGGATINISNFDNSISTTVVAAVDSNVGGVTRIATAAGSFGVQATGTYSNGIINLQFTAGAGGISGYSCNMSMKKE